MHKTFERLRVISLPLLAAVALDVHQPCGPPTPNATKSFWLANSPWRNYRSTKSLPTKVDITVIGAGMSGASIVYHLTEHYASQNQSIQPNILLLDAREAAGGATGRNGGALHASGNVSNYARKKLGAETAQQIADFKHKTGTDILDFIDRHDMRSECGINMDGLCVLSESKQPKQDNKSEKSESTRAPSIALEARYNESETKRLTGLSVDNQHSSVYRRLSGYFWPARVVFRLVREAVDSAKNGLNVQFGTTVHNIEFDSEKRSWTVQTDRGPVESKILVLATNGYTSFLLPQFANKIYPAKNQMIASKPRKNRIWRESFFISDNDDYEYYHQNVHLDNRIFIGGGREIIDGKWEDDYNDSVMDQRVSKHLKEWIPNRYKNVDEIEVDMEWAGILGFSTDGLPWVGPVLDENGKENGLYICAGFSGSGMALCFNCGKAVAMMIAGKEAELVPAFLPSARAVKIV